MKRRNSRIKAMMALYNYDITNILEFNNIDELTNEDQVGYDYHLYKEIVYGVIEKLEKIDFVISNNLVKYSLDRLNYVDRAIIRISTFEVMYTDTPKEIIINEALEISKEYSETENTLTSKFNNSLLDKIIRFIDEHGKK